jgi:hypothetical protein
MTHNMDSLIKEPMLLTDDLGMYRGPYLSIKLLHSL